MIIYLFIFRTFDYVLVLKVKIKSLILRSSLSWILSSNLTWLMNQVELKLLEFSANSSSKLFVGFDWAGVGFEHVIVIVKLSLKIHYSAWFLIIALGLVEVLHISLSFFPVFSWWTNAVLQGHFKFEVLFFVLEYFHLFWLFMFCCLFGNVSRCFVIKK